MPDKRTSQIDIASDLVRIHSIMTRALNVAVERSADFAQSGYPDPSTGEGFIAYVRCLAALLHSHHLTEDESVFPSLEAVLKDVPFDVLVAQHHEMGPLIDRVEAALDEVSSSSQAGASMNDLNRALAELRALWLTHIEQEEDLLSAERIDPLVDMDEQTRLSKSFANHSAKLQMRSGLLSTLVPFMIYNLSGTDRELFARAVPWIVTRVLVPLIWKKKWQPMSPFLLLP
jgi:hemerythrin-like domain-containing protein